MEWVTYQEHLHTPYHDYGIVKCDPSESHIHVREYVMRRELGYLMMHGALGTPEKTSCLQNMLRTICLHGLEVGVDYCTQ